MPLGNRTEQILVIESNGKGQGSKGVALLLKEDVRCKLLKKGRDRLVKYATIIVGSLTEVGIDMKLGVKKKHIHPLATFLKHI